MSVQLSTMAIEPALVWKPCEAISGETSTPSTTSTAMRTAFRLRLMAMPIGSSSAISQGRISARNT